MPSNESSCHPLLLVGLGNPGDSYQKTRHNIGFMAVDSLALRAASSYVYSPALYGEVAEYMAGKQPIILLKPATYMNRSGKSVLAAIDKLHISPVSLIVVHDDLDLEFGRVKITVDHGAGGHKGVQSIIEELQSKAFVRIKCGIGRPPDTTAVVDYVLAPFAVMEKERLPAVLETICAAINLLVEKGVVAAMNSVNKEASARQE